MGVDPLFIRLHYRTPGRKEKPSGRTIKKTRLWDRVWEYHGKTPGHLRSDHDHQIIWWPSTGNHGSPGDWLFSHKIRPTLVDVLTGDESQWRSIDGALTYERRIYVPAALCSRVASLFHDNPESGHSGALKTADLISRDCFWPAIESEISKYVASCELCHPIKALRHARYGLSMPPPPPYRPCEGLTTDYVTNVPESTASRFTGILVIIDRLPNMETYLPCRKHIDSPELARMVFEHKMCKRGVRDNITTDCGMEFTSQFCDRVCYHLSINHRLSTAFLLQTDGQTERQNQTMEQYLRVFCN